MATTQHDGLLTYKDEAGDLKIMYPATRGENVLMENGDTVEEAVGKKSDASNLVNGAGTLSVRTNTSYSSANGMYAHAFGSGCHSDRVGSFTSGQACTASHDYGIAMGLGLQAPLGTMAIFGRYNNAETAGWLIVGNGYQDDRSNALRLTMNGWLYAELYNTGGADYAEYFEWADGNPDGQDRVGYFVTLDGDKICFAGAGDDAVGIISGTAAVVGDSYDDDWHMRFLKDAFGRKLLGEREVPAETDMDGTEISPAHTVEWFVTNPDWNREEAYIPRSERREWDIVGLMGKLYVRDDGSAAAGGYVKPADGGIATASEERTRWRVLERTDDNIVRVMMRG